MKRASGDCIYHVDAPWLEDGHNTDEFQIKDKNEERICTHHLDPAEESATINDRSLRSRTLKSASRDSLAISLTNRSKFFPFESCLDYEPTTAESLNGHGQRIKKRKQPKQRSAAARKQNILNTDQPVSAGMSPLPLPSPAGDRLCDTSSALSSSSSGGEWSAEGLWRDFSPRSIPPAIVLRRALSINELEDESWLSSSLIDLVLSRFAKVYSDAVQVLSVEFSQMRLDKSDLQHITDINGNRFDYKDKKRSILLIFNSQNIHWNLLRVVRYPQPELQLFEPMGLPLHRRGGLNLRRYALIYFCFGVAAAALFVCWVFLFELPRTTNRETNENYHALNAEESVSSPQWPLPQSTYQ